MDRSCVFTKDNSGPDMGLGSVFQAKTRLGVGARVFGCLTLGMGFGVEVSGEDTFGCWCPRVWFSHSRCNLTALSPFVGSSTRAVEGKITLRVWLVLVVRLGGWCGLEGSC